MGKLKAALYDLLMRPAGAKLDLMRREVVSIASGRVLELGVGTGLNLRFYQPGSHVIAIDPDIAMLDRARSRADASPARVHLLVGAGESLPFRDETFDEAVATLVFCTVPSPARSLAEIRRVLKPGGRMRFMEHVRSSDPRWAHVQDFVTPVWRAMNDGCCPNRDTVTAIERAGFVVEGLQRYAFGPYPVRPQVRGVACRVG
ncbi:MAG TPA: class I SAM-dependent methyltransferase [Chloroflexota bacterium]|nr:class I SAM-dependent methyltransferase [Chloroflexota bacterium]